MLRCKWLLVRGQRRECTFPSIGIYAINRYSFTVQYSANSPAIRQERGMDHTHSFGYWLKRRRKALDLTQAELARRASCSLDLVQKIEADARRPSRQMAEKMAEVLGVDAAERAAFIQTARAERAVDQLDVTTTPLEQPQRS